ncbi:MAG: outer membrane beta-barrel protein, partial [Bacteroidales bacterium]
DIPPAAVTIPSSANDRVNEKMLIVPAEEPMRLLAYADVNLANGNEDRSLPVSGDDITVIASGRLTGGDEVHTLILTPGTPDAVTQRFLVGASLSPTMGFSPGAEDMRLSELMNGEKSRPAYTTGLTFGYKLSDRLTIQSGIGLSSIGQTITGVDVFAGLSGFYAVKSSYLYSVETASGLILSGNTDLYLTDKQARVGTLVQGADPSKYQLTQIGDDIQQVFRYLELPLMLRYKVIDSRLGLNLSGGFAYGLLVDNMAYTGTGSDMVTVGHTEGINIHNLSSQLGLGMEYNISSKISFNLEPVFKYYVTPISDIYGAFYKPYSLGVWSGFFFKF